jgi:phosphoribosylamine--glycine ligase
MMPVLKILVIGSGGREHAIAWKLAGEGHQIFAWPGNPGIAPVAAIEEIPDPDLTVVGPEAPLVDGIVDRYRAKGLPIVGPTQENARLEGSKIHSKEVMQRLGIPTARFVRVEAFHNALESLSKFDYPLVIKADGLAAGKGVVIAHNRTEAEQAIQALGPKLVIEEFLQGEEVSFIALCDGRDFVAFEPTQDHKTVGDNDTGPNTGGMGAYCDGRILSGTEIGRVMDTIIAPVVTSTRFTGFLYAGLMMTSDGPKVLEFNVRMGDPETQPLMARMDSEFADFLMRAAAGTLKGSQFRWKPEPSVCVVLAAAGYPGKVRTGDAISGLDQSRAQVFQAGTRLGPQGLETAGGRVLGVTASGPNLAAAIARTYAAVEKIHFDGMHYRHDIGKKGLKRWTADTIGNVGT